MCRRVECNECHKPTYAGCGMHVEQVLADVAKDQRCQCREQRKEKKGAGADPSLFSRIFGK